MRHRGPFCRCGHYSTSIRFVKKTARAQGAGGLLLSCGSVFSAAAAPGCAAAPPARKQRFRRSHVTLVVATAVLLGVAAEAVQLFDAIHTVDRPKIAEAIAREMRKQAKPLKLFVQVNTGREPQKAGIDPGEADAFLRECRDVHGIEISGLMCIPPAEEDPRPHFEMLAEIARRNGLAQLSMGMSADYETAVNLGATHVRVGSAIFGHRD